MAGQAKTQRLNEAGCKSFVYVGDSAVSPYFENKIKGLCTILSTKCAGFFNICAGFKQVLMKIANL
jgi:hypothetical protein